MGVCSSRPFSVVHDGWKGGREESINAVLATFCLERTSLDISESLIGVTDRSVTTTNGGTDIAVNLASHVGFRWKFVVDDSPQPDETGL